MPIPKIAHRIWFGEPFPERYKTYLSQLATLNPDHVTKLWTDPESMSGAAYSQLSEFCHEHKIVLNNIRDFPKLPNFKAILSELETAKKNQFHKRIHYVRASDRARLAILEKEGGTYSDTDSECLAPLPEFKTKHEILLKLQRGFEENTNINFFQLSDDTISYQYYFYHILYDFIAAAPGHPLIKLANEISELDYRTYFGTRFREWECTTNASNLAFGTVRLTGTALKFALNYAHQQGYLRIDNPVELFVDSETFMPSHYDKSWLEGFQPNKDSSDLDAFLDDIDHNRTLHYPCKNAENHPDLTDEKPHYSRVNLFIQPPLPIVKALTAPKISVPEISVPKLETLVFKVPIKILTNDEIRAVYQKNGGGLISSFTIFKDPATALAKLKKRAIANSAGASSKTLKELRL